MARRCQRRSTPERADDACGRRIARRCSSAVVVVAAPAAVAAQIDGDRPPQTQRTLSPAGETEVNYYSGGTLTQSTRIPADSVFNTSGRGSGGGGVAQPCFEFSWFVTEPNPNAVVDPVTSAVVDATTGLPTTPDQSVEVRQPSTAWIYREVVPTGTWTPEQQGVIDAADVALTDGRVDMTAPNRFGALYLREQPSVGDGDATLRRSLRPPTRLRGWFRPRGPALRRGADGRPVLEPAGAPGDLVGDGAVAAVPGDRAAGGRTRMAVWW